MRLGKQTFKRLLIKSEWLTPQKHIKTWMSGDAKFSRSGDASNRIESNSSAVGFSFSYRVLLSLAFGSPSKYRDTRKTSKQLPSTRTNIFVYPGNILVLCVPTYTHIWKHRGWGRVHRSIGPRSSPTTEIREIRAVRFFHSILYHSVTAEMHDRSVKYHVFHTSHKTI